ncbi:alpha/beta hydrolase [Ensifer sp. NBAIM29]|nr:alpha/beta hydrolase [Ensifer sp. NBAIM29]
MKGTWVRKSNKRNTVVFIHGFVSDNRAWQHTSGAYWPELLANDRKAKDVGVFIFEYKTSAFSGDYSISDVVDALETELRLQKIDRGDSLIFVCHSMGGIVARRYLIRRESHIKKAVKHIGLMLIASPALGSEYANWVKAVADFVHHSQLDALKLSAGNTWLRDLDKDFADLRLEDRLTISGLELIEDKFIIPKLPFLKPVVQSFSGWRYFRSLKIPESTHFDIATIENRQAVQYRLLVELIETVIPARTSPDLTDNDVRFLLALENGNRLPEQAEDLAVRDFGYRPDPLRPGRTSVGRLERLLNLGYAERVGGNEFALSDQGLKFLRDRRKRPGNYKSVITDRRKLTYVMATKADDCSLEGVLRKGGDASFAYGREVDAHIRKLASVMQEPSAFLKTIPHSGNTIPGALEDEKRATNNLLILAEVYQKLDTVVVENDGYLERFRDYLWQSSPSRKNATAALRAFAAFAALRVIHILRGGFEWDDGHVRRWFDHYAIDYSKNPSPPYFELANDTSSVGKIVFGHAKWVQARAGHLSDYQHVILPEQLATQLFIDEVRGDDAAFWEWVAPQLALRPGDQLTAFPRSDWVVSVLIGNRGEWWSPTKPCPWRDH